MSIDPSHLDTASLTLENLLILLLSAASGKSTSAAAAAIEWDCSGNWGRAEAMELVEEGEAEGKDILRRWKRSRFWWWMPEI